MRSSLRCMSKIATVLILSALAAGCAIPVHSVRGADSAKLVVGQTVVLQSEAMIVECQPFDSNARIWFAPKRARTCIAPYARGDERVLGKLPAGTSLVIRRMKYIDAFDEEYRFVYLRSPTGGEDLVAYDFHLFRLLGMDRRPSR